MNTKRVDADNIEEYLDYVDEDVSENMDRLYYRGLAAHDPDDDDLLSLLIWEIKSPDSEKKTRAELKWIYAADPSYISSLLDDYHGESLTEGVKKTYFESSSIDKEKEDALRESGFTIKQVEHRDIGVTVEECAKLSISRISAPPYVQSIDILEDMEFQQGLMNILFKYDDPSLEDIAYLPRQWYEPSVSCYTKTDGKVTGLLLVHACPSGILVPVLLFAVGSDAKINLIEMMRYSISQAADIYPGDTLIRIHRRNRSVRKLSGKLFPDKKGEPAIAGIRPEEETDEEAPAGSLDE